jgi:hypothetical protein
MQLSYSDSRIKLSNVLLMQFDQGREIPALLHAICKNPNSLGIQERTMMIRMLGALAGRRAQPTTLAIGVQPLAVLSVIHAFLNGVESSTQLLTLEPSENLQASVMVEELRQQLKPSNCVSSSFELVQRCEMNDDFLIICLMADATQEINLVIEMFANGRKGILFIANYGYPEYPSHYETARNQGMRILELPDGSGELMSL